jgi:hypothetical protein
MVNIFLRFDLVFCLLDTKNSEWDRVVSSYILRGKNPAQELATTSRPDTWSFSMLQVSCKCFFSLIVVDPDPDPYCECGSGSMCKKIDIF